MKRWRLAYLGAGIFLTWLIFIAAFGAYSGMSPLGCQPRVPLNEVPAEERQKRTDDTKGFPESLVPKGAVGTGAELHSENGHSQREDEQCGSFEASLKALFEWLFRVMDMKVSDVVIAFFTVILALKTNELVKETALLRTIAGRQADADRPHMMLDKFTVSKIREAAMGEGDPHLAVEYNFLNSGPGLSFLKKVCIMRGIYKVIPDNPVYIMESDTNFIIAPNSGWGSYNPQITKISQEQAVGILDGSIILIFYGYIFYSDLSGRDLKFRFCYQFTWSDGDQVARGQPAGPESYWEYT